MILTGVSAHICSAHRGRDGRLHGHTWRIKAWFPAGSCALALKTRLEAVCEPFDHTELMDELATGEAMAAAIAEQLTDAVQIDVERPIEGIFARFTRSLAA